MDKVNWKINKWSEEDSFASFILGVLANILDLSTDFCLCLCVFQGMYTHTDPNSKVVSYTTNPEMGH